MDAWIAVGLCAAWLGDGPALNQPRPLTAQPAASVVVPVGYFDEGQWRAVPFIPPAPLPAFYPEELPQIHFEFSQLEACSDSQLHPPAPPAELEATSTLIELHDGRSFRARPCEAGAESVCGEPPCPASSELPQTIDQLHHLQTAFQHLEAAGMKDAAQQLRRQHRAAAAHLRCEIEQQLAAKEAELQQITEEIVRLKADLVGDASLTFQVELYSVDLNQLRKLAEESTSEIASAARILLDDETSTTPDKNGFEQQLEALRLLSQHKCVQILSRPQIRMLSGMEATVFQGAAVPVTTDDFLQQTGTRLNVWAEIRPDGNIASDIRFQYADPQHPHRVTATRSQTALKPGETVCLGGLRTISDDQGPDGTVTHRDELRIVVLTPRIIRRDEPSPAIIGVDDPPTTGRVRLTDASEPPLPVERLEPRFDLDVPEPPAPAPFHLIPSPATLGRPSLLFPTAPMRAVENPTETPEFELPPAPLPPEDTDDDPVA